VFCDRIEHGLPGQILESHSNTLDGDHDRGGAHSVVSKPDSDRSLWSRPGTAAGHLLISGKRASVAVSSPT